MGLYPCRVNSKFEILSSKSIYRLKDWMILYCWCFKLVSEVVGFLVGCL